MQDNRYRHWKQSYLFFRQSYIVRYLFLQKLLLSESVIKNQPYHFQSCVRQCSAQSYPQFQKRDFAQRNFSQQQFLRELVELCPAKSSFFRAWCSNMPDRSFESEDMAIWYFQTVVPSGYFPLP